MANQKRRGNAEFTKWMGPLLEALRDVGGSCRPREASDWIARKHALTSQTTDAVTSSGQERFHNQVQWARQYLVWEGLIDNKRRGIWTLTPRGAETSLDETQSRAIFLKWVAHFQEIRDKAIDQPSGDESVAIQPHVGDEEISETDLLSTIRALPPEGFEQLCRRILYESGFTKVEVTGRSHDGGFDGFGILHVNPLIPMRVLFQSKRYGENTAVSRSEVGDFRNAIMGRAEKGILFTTSRFSTEASKEASREGVLPIELVDSERLVELMEDLKLGVIEKVVFDVDHEFFRQFMEFSKKKS